MTCQLELVTTFIHIITPAEENISIGNPIRKPQPLIDHIKNKCFELYQPLKEEVSVDEQMVKSKARCHFKQYMESKPKTWGIQVGVLANMKGYTVDFNIYTEKSTEKSDLGLSHDGGNAAGSSTCISGPRTLL